jgi:hypothetical protein
MVSHKEYGAKVPWHTIKYLYYYYNSAYLEKLRRNTKHTNFSSESSGLLTGYDIQLSLFLLQNRQTFQ